MNNFGENNPYYGGGGGFVGGSQGSQESPGGGKKNKSQSIRPVTVKQLIESEQTHGDAEHTIDGHEVHQVLLVGSITNKSTTATNVSYEIGDGTGYIDVRQWLDTADDDTGKMDGIEQDTYVAIMGSIKVFGGKKHVSATHIRAIKDHNEVYNHLLKALYVTLSLRNPGGGAGAGRGATGDYSAGGVGGAADSSNYAHLPPIQRKIMEIVAADDADDGIHVQAVSRAVGNGPDVMDAIETLMQEGMLFSTIDDLHVKAV